MTVKNSITKDFYVKQVKMKFLGIKTYEWTVTCAPCVLPITSDRIAAGQVRGIIRANSNESIYFTVVRCYS